MKQCWRWFGPGDQIPLDDLHQVGVEGIVTALHKLPPGTVWSAAQISERQAVLRAAGYEWDVVESLPVSEAIKTQGPQMRAHITAYKASLEALAAANVTTICYNFMPILDWTRTNLRAEQPHGGAAMRFDLIDFAVFDLHILQRAEGAESYSEAQRATAAERFNALSDEGKKTAAAQYYSGVAGCQ